MLRGERACAGLVCPNGWVCHAVRAPGVKCTMAALRRDASLPTGPLFVPAAHAGDPLDLRITLRVNGTTYQDESTADMLFDVAALIAHISDVAELRPGDLVLTGSPAGNGASHSVFLKPGDVMEGEITGLGVHRNRCVAETDAPPPEPARAGAAAARL